MKIVSKMLSMFKTSATSVKNKISNPMQSKIKVDKDSFELTPQALEAKFLNEVREYGKKHNLETVRIIDKDGKILNIATHETPLDVSFRDENFVSLFLKLDGSNFIHNHNLELPLSFNDINFMLNMQISKMTATTPGGGISSIVFPKNKMMRLEGDKVISPCNSFAMGDDIEKISVEEIEILKKLKIFNEDEKIFTSNLFNAPKEIIQKISQWRKTKIQEFADKYGLEYTHVN